MFKESGNGVFLMPPRKLKLLCQRRKEEDGCAIEGAADLRSKPMRLLSPKGRRWLAGMGGGGLGKGSRMHARERVTVFPPGMGW